MKLSKMQALVVLIAAMVVCINNILSKREITKSLLLLLVTIVGFYILTSIAIRIINKVIESGKEENADDASHTENDEEESEDGTESEEVEE